MDIPPHTMGMIICCAMKPAVFSIWGISKSRWQMRWPREGVRSKGSWLLFERFWSIPRVCGVVSLSELSFVRRILSFRVRHAVKKYPQFAIDLDTVWYMLNFNISWRVGNERACITGLSLDQRTAVSDHCNGRWNNHDTFLSQIILFFKQYSARGIKQPDWARKTFAIHNYHDTVFHDRLEGIWTKAQRGEKGQMQFIFKIDVEQETREWMSHGRKRILALQTHTYIRYIL